MAVDQDMITWAMVDFGNIFFERTLFFIDDREMLPIHARMIAAILKDLKLEDKVRTKADLEKVLRQVFKGKRVLEIGCRGGLLLAFLAHHGAVVMGTTSHQKMAAARRALGENVIEANVETAWKTSAATFNPNFLISINLLDKHRWKESTPPLARMTKTLYQAAGPNTRVYLIPSIDSGAVIPNYAFQRLRRIWGMKILDHLLYGRHLSKEHQHDTHVIRFRVSRRNRKMNRPKL